MMQQKHKQKYNPPSNKRLCRTPLEHLWNEEGVLKAHRLRDLTSEQIKQMLHQEPVIFVLASAGHKLQWYQGEQVYTFWQEVRNYICDELEEGCSLEDFSGEQFFFAAEWRLETGELVIVLEHQH